MALARMLNLRSHPHRHQQKLFLWPEGMLSSGRVVVVLVMVTVVVVVSSPRAT